MPHRAFKYPSAGSLAQVPDVEEAIAQARRHPDGGILAPPGHLGTAAAKRMYPDLGEPIRLPLHDTVYLVPGTASSTCFVSAQGKTAAEISPVIVSGGSLSAPRMYEVHRLRIRPISLDLTNMGGDAAAWRRIRAHGSIRLIVGICEYFNGPIGLLPYTLSPVPILIPPQQRFRVTLDFPLACAIDRAWRVIVYLDGYLGYEVV